MQMRSTCYLDENLSKRDERSAELCREQAADEEITQSSSEELQSQTVYVRVQFVYVTSSSLPTRATGMKMRSSTR